MKAITKKQLAALGEMVEFVEAYVEYHITDIPVTDEPTDAQLLSKILPTVKSVFKNKEIQKPKPKVVEKIVTDKDALYFAEKRGAESADPNYKYCVCDDELHQCYLSDDEVACMELAAKKSIDGKMWYVYEIRKRYDETFTTYILGIAKNGHYDEKERAEEFLHYDFIAKSVMEIHKI